jgi:hypothetical protein
MSILPKEVLASVYTEFDTPADQLLVDSTIAAKFTARVRELVGKPVTQQAVLSRLLSLRKNALLPRLRK